jgi:hypothetical protein
MALDDDRISRAKAVPMDRLMQQLELTGLKRGGAEWTGPCPRCGGDDRFSINTRKGMFLCRHCEADGGKGDGIALVQFVRGVDFAAAVAWMLGPDEALTPSERADRDRRAAENADRKAKEAESFRRRAVAQAREMWQAGVVAEGTQVRAYLALRGITADLLPRLPISLRYHADLPYMVLDTRTDTWVQAHRGPAMLAAIQGPDHKFCGVHRTWFDPEAPLGKITIAHPVTGEVMPRKKIWGHKKGGVIRLAPGLPGHNATLVMGEGIETTLSALVAGVYPEAIFWAGVDLGNMAGRRQTGPGLKYAGLPALDDGEAFVPPPGITRLIYVMDGDSEPRETRAKLEAGLRRAMMLRPGLRGQIAAAPKGFDLNDVLLGQGAAE